MNQNPLNMKKPEDRHQNPVRETAPDSGRRKAVAWRSWEAGAEKLRIDEADGIAAHMPH